VFRRPSSRFALERATLGAVLSIAIASRAFAADHTAVQNLPIQLGTSGGSAADLSRRFCCGGTLGALVVMDGQYYVLSNNHVLARSGAAGRREPIIQPGLDDANCSADGAQVVARFRRNFVPLGTSNVDAAVAHTDPSRVDSSGALLDLGVPCSSPLTVNPGMSVEKSGRSGLSTGTVEATDLAVRVDYQPSCNAGGSFRVIFRNQISITPGDFSQSGDSGSLILTTDLHPVGLLFAGTSSQTVANPIGDVLHAFRSRGHQFDLVGQDCASAAAVAVGVVGDEELAAARPIKERHEAELFADEGVLAIGLGKLDQQARRPRVALVVYLDRSRPAPALPAVIEGLPVRVIPTDPFIAR
jgi:hypothetical protein